jgi:SNF2 family DNA or RNA helicase
VLGGPFPWPVETGELTLHLPAAGGSPLASPRLVRAETAPAGPAAGLDRFEVSALELEPGAALDLLVSLPAEPPPGVVLADSLRFWGEAAKLALELVARGRVVPGLEELDGEYLARWRPVTSSAVDAERVELLLRAMPPAARAAAPDRSGRELLDDALVILTDACACEALAGRTLARRRIGRRGSQSPAAEAWLRALTAEDPGVEAPPAELKRLKHELDEWLRAATGSTASGLRTCFRLTPPEGTDAPATNGDSADLGDSPDLQVADGAWRLDFLLQAADDPSLLVPADRVWRARGDALRALRRTIDRPQERLLADLGRAMRIYPELEPALHTPTPTGLELDTAGAHRFLRDAAPLLSQAGFGVRVPPWWSVGRARLGMRLRTAPTTEPGEASGLLGLHGLCAYQWEVALGDATIPLAELRRLARLKVPLVRLRGEWVELRREELDAALRIFESGAESGEMRIGDALRLATGMEGSPAGLPVHGIEAEGWLAELLRTNGERTIRPVAPPRGFAGTLRPYQARGLAWLAFLDGLGLGACLADDMGLGKTVQLLALLQLEREAGAGGRTGKRKRGRTGPAPTLLVCPMSVVGNWQREAARFTPELRVHVHHGGERLSGKALARAVRGADLVITTYALAARDRDQLASIDWERVALDEAQNIKNSGARQTQAVRSLPARRRLALTGTPVENRLAELWSILDFLNPGVLGSQSDFRTRFAIPIERYHHQERAEQLRRVTGPFILRRLKTDRTIIQDLPEKFEIGVICNLTREQASLYQAVVDDMLAKIEESEGIERRGLVLATMTRLKQVCNHPAQLLQDRSALAGRSGKLARLEETLEEVLAVGDRALVFTQYAEMGHLLRSHLQERFSREILFLHGGTPKKARDEMVARFQADGGPPVFLLSLRAGGTGLNLTAANHVIHFDRWWNPAVEDQATDRAFRIGQRRDVQVRKLICAGTLEERIDRMIEQKKALAERVVGTGESWLTELSTAELRKVVELSSEAVVE